MNPFPLLRHLVPGLPLLMVFVFSGCASLRDYEELPAPDYVDLAQVTKVWHVQGHLPTVADQTAHDSTYEIDRRRDGSLRVIYSFNAGAPGGPIKEYEFKGKVDDITTNADWSVRKVWPFESDYRVLYVSSDYTTMVLGNANRKNLFILSDAEQMPERDYQWLLDLAASLGYDTSYVRRVPHS